MDKNNVNLLNNVILWQSNRGPLLHVVLNPGVGGGGGGDSKNVYTGRFRPEVQPPTLLHTIFQEKGTPFVYLILTNGTPFTYLV